ncbi:MAG TPA: hypothetical protein VGR35_11720 [Tepidisphaeraceae bacterium]|nr:hypothetical protein [Tepidisphaeraceae bacterium]
MHDAEISAPLARGSLELIWDTAYESGDPYIGDKMDVELAAEWEGDPGKLFTALLGSGGQGRAGFIEEVPNHSGFFQVHDLWDHAPEYVKKRYTRERARKNKDLRHETSAIRLSAADTGRRSAPNGHPPSPTPTPTPTPKEEDGARENGKPVAGDRPDAREIRRLLTQLGVFEDCQEELLRLPTTTIERLESFITYTSRTPRDGGWVKNRLARGQGPPPPVARQRQVTAPSRAVSYDV